MDVKFTEREKTILKELTKGKNYREISETLYISISTVKHYMAQISEKLGIKRKINIILYVLEHGYINKNNIQ
ncbi:response regulator transcription factor [bacterium]|nr:response regulator transcription factor [bacterium]